MPDMEAYAKGFSSVTSEVSFRQCEPSVGKIPSDLCGTYFRNGPAMFTAGSIPPMGFSAVNPKEKPVADGVDMSRMVSHPFEGDGAIVGITFHEGDENVCSLRYKYVKTTGFEKERKKGKKLYSGMESTRSDRSVSSNHPANDYPLPLYRHHLQSGLNKNRKNTSNTRTVFWANRLMSLWEGGLPYKMDSLALQTEGKSQLGGVLEEAAPFSGKGTLDSNQNRMLFYSNEQDVESSLLTIYEFDESFKLIGDKFDQRKCKLPGLAVMNDFAVTEKYSIFVQPKTETNSAFPFVMSKDPSKLLNLQQQYPSTIHLIPRLGFDGMSMKSFEIPVDTEGCTDIDLHFCNAYMDEDIIIFDAIRSDTSNIKSSFNKWPWITTLEEYSSSVSRKSLWRYRVNTIDGKVEKEPLFTDYSCAFGTVNPAVSSKKHKYIYANVGAISNKASPPQGIAKFNCESKTVERWMPEAYQFAGEPIFTSRQKTQESVDEDDGYIISLLFDGKSNESELLIFDAKDIEGGPITRVPLGLSIAHGLFGCFASDGDACCSSEELERRSKLADKMEKKGNRWNEVKSDFSGLGLRLDDFDEYFGDFL